MSTISGMTAGNEQYLLEKYARLGQKEAKLKLMWRDDPLNVVWDELRKVEREKATIERLVGYYPDAK